MGECSGLMPFRGIFGFLAHPELYKMIVVPLLVTMCFAIVTLVALFTFGFNAQVSLLNHWVGRWGLPKSVEDALVVVMIFVNTGLLTFAFFQALFGHVQKAITLHILQERGVAGSLKNKYGIDLDPDQIECPCGAVARNVIFVCVRLTLMLLLLPLDTWPVFGAILWFAINGWIYTWDLLADFIPALGNDTVQQQLKYAGENAIVYAKFGGIALLLEFVPVAGPLFKFSNAVGAALVFEGLLHDWSGPAADCDYVRA